MRILFFLTLLLTALLNARQQPSGGAMNVVAGYSIVAWDSLTGDLGVAVSAGIPSVGAIAPFAKSGVGAIVTQGLANTTCGTPGLESLSRGSTPQQCIEDLLLTDSLSKNRQLGIVDAKGRGYGFTGSACSPYAGHVSGPGYVVLGCNLAGEGVLRKIAATYEANGGDLAERLLSALYAGAGGGRSPGRSAALLVVRDAGGYGGLNDRFVDLRVDDDSLAVAELLRIYRLSEGTYLLAARMRSIEEFKRKRNFDAADGEIRRVVKSFNEQIRRKPDDPEVLNQVAWTLASHDIDRDRALELSQRAAKLAPDKPYIRNTMAECQYRLGHFDVAIAIEAELVTKDPSNDEFWKQLQKFRDAKQKAGQ